MQTCDLVTNKEPVTLEAINQRLEQAATNNNSYPLGYVLYDIIRLSCILELPFAEANAVNSRLIERATQLIAQSPNNANANTKTTIEQLSRNIFQRDQIKAPLPDDASAPLMNAAINRLKQESETAATFILNRLNTLQKSLESALTADPQTSTNALAQFDDDIRSLAALRSIFADDTSVTSKIDEIEQITLIGAAVRNLQAQIDGFSGTDPNLPSKILVAYNNFSDWRDYLEVLDTQLEESETTLALEKERLGVIRGLEWRNKATSAISSYANVFADSNIHADRLKYLAQQLTDDNVDAQGVRQAAREAAQSLNPDIVLDSAQPTPSDDFRPYLMYFILGGLELLAIIIAVIIVVVNQRKKTSQRLHTKPPQTMQS